MLFAKCSCPTNPIKIQEIARTIQICLADQKELDKEEIEKPEEKEMNSETEENTDG